MYAFRNAIEVRGGQHLHLKVQPMVFNADKEIKADFPIEKRQCRFPDEESEQESSLFDNFASMFKSYTSQGCEFACIAKESFVLLQCLPPYFPVPVRETYN